MEFDKECGNLFPLGVTIWMQLRKGEGVPIRYIERVPKARKLYCIEKTSVISSSQEKQVNTSTDMF